jgi:hypothetical protein
MVHWWLLGRSGRHLRWGQIWVDTIIMALIKRKPVREICTVPSSECFTLGNHPTSSRAPALKPRDFRSENIARKRSKPHTKALVGKFLLVWQSALETWTLLLWQVRVDIQETWAPSLNSSTETQSYTSMYVPSNNSAETLSEAWISSERLTDLGEIFGLVGLCRIRYTLAQDLTSFPPAN